MVAPVLSEAYAILLEHGESLQTRFQDDMLVFLETMLAAMPNMTADERETMVWHLGQCSMVQSGLNSWLESISDTIASPSGQSGEKAL